MAPRTKHKQESGGVINCEFCNTSCRRFGFHRNGLRRFRCQICKRTYTEAHERTLGGMYISPEDARRVVQLLVEGDSIRSTQRISDLDQNTIMKILVLAGEKCSAIMGKHVRNVQGSLE